jgi:HAD superfamily hydrolase (TIGR01549 family)
VTLAVVFDLDGTLVNLPIDYERLFQEVRERAKIGDVQPITKTIARLDPTTKGEIFEIWDKLEAVAWQRGTVKKAGISLYHKFSKEPKALVTMQGKTLTRKINDSLKLSFDVIVTREDSLDRAEQLRIAARALNVSPKDTLFIGNTEGDSIAAKDVKSEFLRVEE